MSNPRPSDTNRVPRTSRWREGVTAPPLTLGAFREVDLQPAPVHRQPAENLPASTSETGRKSSAGLETPPFTLLVPAGPWLHTSRLQQVDLHTGNKPPLNSLHHACNARHMGRTPSTKTEAEAEAEAEAETPAKRQDNGPLKLSSFFPFVRPTPTLDQKSYPCVPRRTASRSFDS